MTLGRSSTIPARGDVILVPFPFAELTTTKMPTETSWCK